MSKLKNRRLKTIAKWINEHLAPELHAQVDSVFVNTDRPKPKGLRYRVHTGKGRHGNRLVVRDGSGNKLLDHNAAEAYRYNWEVEMWLDEWVRKNGSRKQKRAHKRDRHPEAGQW
jgi:hypothetical protein